MRARGFRRPCTITTPTPHRPDPRLSVGHIALKLDIHHDYLSNLFARQVGERMAKYIRTRRLERAKNLLRITSWQIKRVAVESGFRGPNRFCEAFVRYTGVTPSAYREREARGPKATVPHFLKRLPTA